MSETTLPRAMRAADPVLETEGPGAGLPLHFGLPSAEQELLVQGEAIAYLGHIGVVTVSGPDRLSWLTTLASQVVDGMGPGDSRELLLLDPQGRVEFQAAIVDDGETAWLFTPAEYAAGLAQFLQSMQFMLRVEVTDRTGEYCGFLTINEGEVDTPEGTLVWNDPWPTLQEGGALYFQGDHPGEKTKFRLYVTECSQADGLLEAIGITEYAGSLAVEAARVSSWRPLLSAEGDPRLLPAEVDLMRTAVNMGKGCYRGQESVARIVNLGKPPRRLVFLQLDGSMGELPEPGDAVELDGRKVGEITSVARDYEMGPVALALVKRNLDPEAVLNIGLISAAQEVIVPVDGRSDHAPDQRPGAGLRRIDPGKRDIRTTGPRV